MTLGSTLAALAGGHAPPSGGEVASSVERALLGGLAADRIGYAFASGYRAALSRLVPGVAREACLAATEEGGAHPRAIRTALEPQPDGSFTLTGTKTWITLGEGAEELLVVASEGTEDGKNKLRVARLPLPRAGVTLTPREPAPFAPEIPHSEARFSAARVEPHELLPGDGYDAYLKPFRTIEDLHVLAAFTGYLVSIARRHGAGAGLVEPLVALAVALRGLEDLDPSAPSTHVALAGAFTTCRALNEGPTFLAALAAASPEERARFERDLPLLRVAGRARAARLDAAWKRLAAT